MAAMARLALGVALAVAGTMGTARGQGDRPNPHDAAIAILEAARDREEMADRFILDVLSQVVGIAQVVRSMTSGQRGYDGVDAAAVARSRMLPDRHVVRGGPPTGLRSAFGAVTVRPVNGGQGFEVTVAELPHAECRSLASADLEDQRVSVGVGQSPEEASARAAAADASGMPQAEMRRRARMACQRGDLFDTNVIAWRFR